MTENNNTQKKHKCFIVLQIELLVWHVQLDYTPASGPWSASLTSRKIHFFLDHPSTLWWSYLDQAGSHKKLPEYKMLIWTYCTLTSWWAKQRRWKYLRNPIYNARNLLRRNMDCCHDQSSQIANLVTAEVQSNHLLHNHFRVSFPPLCSQSIILLIQEITRRTMKSAIHRFLNDKPQAIFRTLRLCWLLRICLIFITAFVIILIPVIETLSSQQRNGPFCCHLSCCIMTRTVT